MEISLRHGFAFLCNQKCASSSIKSMLRPHSDLVFKGDFKHTTYRQFERFIQPLIRRKPGGNKVESICIIREPIDQLYSWYRYRARPELVAPTGAPSTRSTSGLTFAEFVESYLLPTPPEYARVPRQFAFVRNLEGNVGVDRLFSYARLDMFVSYLSEKIGVELELPHKNVSPAEPGDGQFARDLDDDLLRQVRRKLQKDIDLYESLSN